MRWGRWPYLNPIIKAKDRYRQGMPLRPSVWPSCHGDKCHHPHPSLYILSTWPWSWPWDDLPPYQWHPKASLIYFVWQSELMLWVQRPGLSSQLGQAYHSDWGGHMDLQVITWPYHMTCHQVSWPCHMTVLRLGQPQTQTMTLFYTALMLVSQYSEYWSSTKAPLSKYQSGNVKTCTISLSNLKDLMSLCRVLIFSWSNMIPPQSIITVNI